MGYCTPTTNNGQQPKRASLTSQALRCCCAIKEDEEGIEETEPQHIKTTTTLHRRTRSYERSEVK
eukprot:scaffold1029_cov194-Amphora_coffeaeformis.AAC.9